MPRVPARGQAANPCHLIYLANTLLLSTHRIGGSRTGAAASQLLKPPVPENWEVGPAAWRLPASQKLDLHDGELPLTSPYSPADDTQLQKNGSGSRVIGCPEAASVVHALRPDEQPEHSRRAFCRL